MKQELLVDRKDKRFVAWSPGVMGPFPNGHSWRLYGGYYLMVLVKFHRELTNRPGSSKGS